MLSLFMVKQPQIAFARKLRKDMSLPEMLIWRRLRKRQTDGPVFRRQYPFGPYVFDFYCAKIKLVIEIDGYHHGVNGQGERDEARDRFLNAQGFEILRIPARDVLAEPDDIADGIYRLAMERQQTLCPGLSGYGRAIKRRATDRRFAVDLRKPTGGWNGQTVFTDRCIEPWRAGFCG
jgi:very-short-patch-repair endonuclease